MHEVDDTVQVVNGCVPLRVIEVRRGRRDKKGRVEDTYLAEIIAGEDVGEKYIFTAYQIEPFEGLRKSMWARHLWKELAEKRKELLVRDAEKE